MDDFSLDDIRVPEPDDGWTSQDQAEFEAYQDAKHEREFVPGHINGTLAQWSQEYLQEMHERIEDLLTEYAKYISVNESYPIRFEATIKMTADSAIESGESPGGAARVLYEDHRNKPITREMNTPIYAETLDNLDELVMRTARQLREQDGLEHIVEGTIHISTLRPNLDEAGIYPVVYEEEIYADFMTAHDCYLVDDLTKDEQRVIFEEQPWDTIKTPQPIWMDMYAGDDDEDEPTFIPGDPDEEESDEEPQPRREAPEWICDDEEDE